MREIKFRAWTNRGKHLWDWENYDREICWHLSGECSYDIILMQYTGLKDKNGVEIYEGDIVKYIPINSKVVIEYGCFIIGHDDWGMDHKTMGFAGNWGDNSIGYCALNNPINLKVIGNIYENPELLKVAE